MRTVIVASTTKFEPSETIEEALLALQEEQLRTNSPPFPWEEFAKQLGNALEIKGLKIEVSNVEVKSQNHIFSGLSEPLVPIHVVISKVDGKIAWVMSEVDLSRILAWVLTKEPGKKTIRDTDIEAGFARFLALEVMSVIEDLKFVEGLLPRLTRDEELPDQSASCVDIVLTYKEQTACGRLILPEIFLSSWNKRFSKRKPAQLSKDMAKSLQVRIGLEAGRTKLSLKEWMSSKEGDCILLDKCTLIPQQDQGQVTLTLEGRSLFKAQLKAGSLKILEQVSMQEIEADMNDDELDDEDYEDEDEDEDYDDEDEDEEELEEDEEEDGEDEEDEEEEETEAEAEGNGLVSAKDIPLTLVVEVARLQTTAEKLLSFGPGTVLDLNVKPDEGVDLLINGKKVGRGELVKIGNSIGVRVLQKG